MPLFPAARRRRTLSGFIFLLCGVGPALLGTSACGAAETRVPLLIRELRGENGELLPLQDEVRRLLAHIERELDISFDIRRYPWNRVISNARAGEGLVFGLSKTSERLAMFRFSEPVFANYVWLVTRRDGSFPFASMRDLQGKTIGVVRGASYGDEFDSQRNKLFRVEEDVSSYAVRLKKLLSKRMDVMLIGDRHPQAEDVEAMLNRILREQVHDLAIPVAGGVSVLRKPLLVDDLHFAIVPEKDDGLIDRLNQVILSGRKSGEFARILFPRK
ncbi:MAG: transporter substrate-binding domain-containing protein [Pseudomonadota bacterium]